MKKKLYLSFCDSDMFCPSFSLNTGFLALCISLAPGSFLRASEGKEHSKNPLQHWIKHFNSIEKWQHLSWNNRAKWMISMIIRNKWCQVTTDLKITGKKILLKFLFVMTYNSLYVINRPLEFMDMLC